MTKSNNPGEAHTEAFKITGDWNMQASKLKQKYAQLTDTDLKFETGKEEELLGRVESKLNKDRKEVINIINKGNSEMK